MNIHYVVVSRNNYLYLSAAINSLINSNKDNHKLIVTVVSNVDKKKLIEETSIIDSEVIEIHVLMLDGVHGYSKSLIEGIDFCINNKIWDRDEIVLAGNDDILFFNDFISNISSIDFKDKTIYAPHIFQANGNLQKSIFRKEYKKLDLFLRHKDGGASSIFFPNIERESLPDNIERRTVDGCLVISNNLRNLRKIFDKEIFLYYEELFFQYISLHKDLSFLISDRLKIMHFGGSTVTRDNLSRRLTIASKSREYVARKYLNFNAIELLFLKVMQFFERLIRNFIKF